MDFGENGVLTTLRHLDAVGLAHAGIGANRPLRRGPRTWRLLPDGWLWSTRPTGVHAVSATCPIRGRSVLSRLIPIPRSQVGPGQTSFASTSSRTLIVKHSKRCDARVSTWAGRSKRRFETRAAGGKSHWFAMSHARSARSLPANW
jgi:hypothetical protein